MRRTFSIFSGTIVSEGQRVDCKVRATKTTFDGDPSIPPELSDYSVMESSATSKLPDGDYEILTNGKAIKVRRKGGRFLGGYSGSSTGKSQHARLKRGTVAHNCTQIAPKAPYFCVWLRWFTSVNH
jgi:hypothetical protein